MDMIIDYFSGTLGQLQLLKLINYWFGLAGVLIMGYVLKEFNLYSDMGLQWFFYAPLQIVGWYMWKYGKTLGDVATDGLNSMKIVTIDWQARFTMATYTDADFAYLDALTTTMSIGASILMLKKIWENWIIWIAMDIIAIPLYYEKEMYVVSMLYIVFLGLATYGLFKWTKDMKAQNA
mgnify:CR=1 FL=1